MKLPNPLNTETLAAAMEKNGVTKADVARDLGCTYLTALRYVSGERTMPLSAFVRVCRLVGIDCRDAIQK